MGEKNTETLFNLFSCLETRLKTCDPNPNTFIPTIHSYLRLNVIKMSSESTNFETSKVAKLHQADPSS
jgi:hypothetical protein